VARLPKANLAARGEHTWSVTVCGSGCESEHGALGVHSERGVSNGKPNRKQLPRCYMHSSNKSVPLPVLLRDQVSRLPRQHCCGARDVISSTGHLRTPYPRVHRRSVFGMAAGGAGALPSPDDGFYDRFEKWPEVSRIAGVLYDVFKSSGIAWDDTKTPTVIAFVRMMNGSSNRLKKACTTFLKGEKAPYIRESMRYFDAAKDACLRVPELRTTKSVRVFRNFSPDERVELSDELMMFMCASVSRDYILSRRGAVLAVCDVQPGVPLLPTVIFHRDNKERKDESEVLLPPTSLACYTDRDISTLLDWPAGEPRPQLYFVVTPRH
jgi:hypothetical protein